MYIASVATSPAVKPSSAAASFVSTTTKSVCDASPFATTARAILQGHQPTDLAQQRFENKGIVSALTILHGPQPRNVILLGTGQGLLMQCRELSNKPVNEPTFGLGGGLLGHPHGSWLERGLLW